MKNRFPTFNEFRKFNNKWREFNKKEHQHKYLVAFYYPFALIGLLLLYSAFLGLLNKTKEKVKYSYRNSNKYRKVIKEGILWDSTEYHER